LLIQPLENAMGTQATFLGQLSYRLVDPIVVEFAIVGFIASLLFESSPFTIPRLIVTIVIDSIEGMVFTGAGTHVCEEGLERFQPPFTHPNTPASVMWIVLVGCSNAPVFRFSPS
jgi:hypothetical protein